MESAAFSPAHITGIVRPYEKRGDPLHSGSKGAGFSIQEGVTTWVEATPAPNEIAVEINGRASSDAGVSRRVAKILLGKAGGDYRIRIRHRVDVPIGVGFGTSGAAALSLVLAMNEALELGWTRTEAAQIAHLAEVDCRTGLGTVLAEMRGGFEARIVPGAPGFGRVLSIPVNGDYAVVALTFGALSTEGMLKELRRRGEAVALGERLLDEFLLDRSIESFLRASNRFAQILEPSPRLEEVLREAGDIGFVCGVALFGETVFTLVKTGEAGEVEKVFRRHMANGSSVLISRIDQRGARLI